jgi:hypothetical protein
MKHLLVLVSFSRCCLPAHAYPVGTPMNLPSIQWNEFTVNQSPCFPAAVYPVPAQGGAWDAKNDPFAGLQK